MGLPFARTARGLGGVLRFALPHKRAILLAFCFMAVQSTASAARILFFYPVYTRILEAQQGAAEPGGRDAQGEALAEGMRRQGGWFTGVLEGAVSGANRLTGRLVPDAWLEDARGTDREVVRDRYATLLTVLVLFLVFTALMAAATYGESFVAEKANLRILMDVRQELCRTLLDQPVAFYDQRRRGELVQRVLEDVHGYAVGLRLMTDLVKGFLHILTTVVVLAFLSWQLTLICLLGLPFLLPMRRLTMRTLKRSHKRQQESTRRVEVLLQIFSGIRTVKAFGTEERRVGEFRRTDEDVTSRALKVQRSKSTADAWTEFINNFLAVTLAVGGGFLILLGVLDVRAGELLIFLALTANLYQPLKRLVKQSNHLQDSLASIERTSEVLGLPPGSPDVPGAVPFEGLRDAIRFESVSFSYVEGQPVLHEVAFEIPRGSTVALVGPSGAGKSTLCDLLLRFYDPESGRITIDGMDVRSFTRASLRRRMAVVTQAPFLFHDTIRENVRQGRLDATDEEVEAAAQAAQIHEFVQGLPQGYEAEVGEMGVRLSGGQRQRITIARALVRDPEILVLDEATASLDTASERAVQEALERLRVGRTTLVVAHRLSTVRYADRIVVLDRGAVVEEGTHEELLARGGLYADLVQMQDLGAAAEPSPAEPA